MAKSPVVQQLTVLGGVVDSVEKELEEVLDLIASPQLDLGSFLQFVWAMLYFHLLEVLSVIVFHR